MSFKKLAYFCPAPFTLVVDFSHPVRIFWCPIMHIFQINLPAISKRCSLNISSCGSGCLSGGAAVCFPFPISPCSGWGFLLFNSAISSLTCCSRALSWRFSCFCTICVPAAVVLFGSSVAFARPLPASSLSRLTYVPLRLLAVGAICSSESATSSMFITRFADWACLSSASLSSTVGSRLLVLAGGGARGLVSAFRLFVSLSLHSNLTVWLTIWLVSFTYWRSSCAAATIPLLSLPH